MKLCAFEDGRDFSIEEKDIIFDEYTQGRRDVCSNPELKQLFLELTLACNEHCIHCGSSCGDVKMRDPLTDDEIVSFLEKLKGQLLADGKQLPQINVTGGEPLLRKNFLKLMTRIHDLGYIWGMTSNGLLITDEMVPELYKAGLRTISISLDGLKETHEWFRQTPNSFDRTIDAIKAICDYNMFYTMVTTCVCKRSLSELDEIRDLVKSLGAQTWRVINIDPIGRAKDNPDLMLSDDDYRYLMNYVAQERKNNTDISVEAGCNHFMGYELEGELRPWFFRCISGLNVASICYDGEITGCLDTGRIPEVMQGNIRDKDFYTTWLNEFEIYRKNRAYSSEFCIRCKYKRQCAGDGFHTWDFKNNKPALCLACILEHGNNMIL